VNRAGDGKRDKDEEKYLYESQMSITFFKIICWKLMCSSTAPFLEVSFPYPVATMSIAAQPQTSLLVNPIAHKVNDTEDKVYIVCISEA